MPFKLKNWKLALLALVFISFLTSLGFWQLARAKQKRLLLTTFAERTIHAPLTVDILRLAQSASTPSDFRFYRTTLTGQFDNQHTLLLDNTIFQQKVGYEVYTPFYANGMTMPLLVDRGFIPLGASRQSLPVIKPITGPVTIMGLLNLPPTYVALGKINAFPQIDWPLRVEYVNMSELKPLLKVALFPYTLSLDPHDKRAFAMVWQVVAFGPERHVGYAVQWFALALTLLIIFVVLNHRQQK